MIRSKTFYNDNKNEWTIPVFFLKKNEISFPKLSKGGGMNFQLRFS